MTLIVVQNLLELLALALFFRLAVGQEFADEEGSQREGVDTAHHNATLLTELLLPFFQHVALVAEYHILAQLGRHDDNLNGLLLWHHSLWRERLQLGTEGLQDGRVTSRGLQRFVAQPFFEVVCRTLYGVRYADLFLVRRNLCLDHHGQGKQAYNQYEESNHLRLHRIVGAKIRILRQRVYKK